MLRIIAILLVIGYGFFAWRIYEASTVAGEKIIIAEQSLAQPSPIPQAIVRFDGSDKGLVVLSWSWLSQDRIWAYASPSSSIDLDYQPEIADIQVTAGDWLPTRQTAALIAEPLTELFAAAKSAGQPLIITSAYRSATEQQELLSNYTATSGQTWTDSHVTKPGHGEHQLGLAVDLSSDTPSCRVNFSGCRLTTQTADWLKNHAYEYGFILRYPEGKSEITGISYEPWHYRYVGSRAAEIITKTDITFDQFIERLNAERAEQ